MTIPSITIVRVGGYDPDAKVPALDGVPLLRLPLRPEPTPHAHGELCPVCGQPRQPGVSRLPAHERCMWTQEGPGAMADSPLSGIVIARRTGIPQPMVAKAIRREKDRRADERRRTVRPLTPEDLHARWLDACARASMTSQNRCGKRR